MAKLKTYDVTINGTQTTMKLTPEEAERLESTEIKTRSTSSSKSKTASTKKRSAKNKAEDSESS